MVAKQASSVWASSRHQASCLSSFFINSTGQNESSVSSVGIYRQSNHDYSSTYPPNSHILECGQLFMVATLLQILQPGQEVVQAVKPSHLTLHCTMTCLLLTGQVISVICIGTGDTYVDVNAQKQTKCNRSDSLLCQRAACRCSTDKATCICITLLLSKATSSFQKQCRCKCMWLYITSICIVG